jgi:hypothetical protein
VATDNRRLCKRCGRAARPEYLDVACSPQCFSDILDIHCERYMQGMLAYAASGRYGKLKWKLESENTPEPTSPNDED